MNPFQNLLPRLIGRSNIAFLMCIMAFAVHADAQMRIHLINVGQGSSMLVEFPCGAILIDAGGESNSLFNSTDALKTYLDDFFTQRPDLNHTLQCVYLTHPHRDHTLGVPVLLQPPYIIKNVVTDGLERGSGKTGQVKLHELAQNNESTVGFVPVTTNLLTGNAGLTNAVIDPVNCSGVDPVIKILWGTSVISPGWDSTTFNNENNHSLVIKIQYGASSIIITGDLEEKAQHSLVTKYDGTTILDADVYVVGHHGSKNGTTAELLKKITPKMALISCGDPARQSSWTAWAYGHPNRGILRTLKKYVTSTRPAIDIQAGNGAKNFANYTVTKAIYATAWDDNVLLEADANGHWQKIDGSLVPTIVNINSATQTELETLPGIGATKAQAIIDFRSSHGNFASVDDLDNVPGIGPATISLLKPYARV